MCIEIEAEVYTFEYHYH